MKKLLAALLLSIGIASAQSIPGGAISLTQPPPPTGACSAGQYVKGLNGANQPTCDTPAGTGVPSIAGTTNQVNESGSPGATTLSLSSTIVLPGTLNGITVGSSAGTNLNLVAGSTFATAGAYSTTLTSTNTTNSTLPAGSHTLAGLDVAQTWDANQTVEGLTTTMPGWYAQLTGDTYQRIRIGLNSTDVASLGMGAGTTARDLFLERAGAASLRFGQPDAAAPIAQTLSVQNASGTDIAGVNTTIIGSLSTGAGTSGDIIFRTGVKHSTGTTLATPITALTIKGESGNVGIGMTTPIAKLQILSDNFVNSILQRSNVPTGGSAIEFLNGGGNYWVTGIDSTTNNNFVVRYNDSSSTGEKLTVTTSGNVGIGMTAPTQLLTLKSTGSLAWDNGSGTVDAGISRFGAGSLYIGNGTAGNASGTLTAANLTAASGAVTLNGNQTRAAWGTSGIKLIGGGSTLTDSSTAGSGTVALAYTDVLGGNTIAATNTLVTYTEYDSLHISKPTAGTNVTIGTSFALAAAGIKIDSGNALQLGNAYVNTVSLSTGYLLVTDSAGTVYEIPAKAH